MFCVLGPVKTQLLAAADYVSRAFFACIFLPSAKCGFMMRMCILLCVARAVATVGGKCRNRIAAAALAAPSLPLPAGPPSCRESKDPNQLLPLFCPCRSPPPILGVAWQQWSRKMNFFNQPLDDVVPDDYLVLSPIIEAQALTAPPEMGDFSLAQLFSVGFQQERVRRSTRTSPSPGLTDAHDPVLFRRARAAVRLDDDHRILLARHSIGRVHCGTQARRRRGELRRARAAAVGSDGGPVRRPQGPRAAGVDGCLPDGGRVNQAVSADGRSAAWAAEHVQCAHRGLLVPEDPTGACDPRSLTTPATTPNDASCAPASVAQPSSYVYRCSRPRAHTDGPQLPPRRGQERLHNSALRAPDRA